MSLDFQIPVSMTGNFITFIAAGGATIQDASTITNVNSITSSTRRRVARKGFGTILLLSLVYNSSLTSITNPVVKLFGRTGTQPWRLLKTRAAALTATLTTAAATDLVDSDGILARTTLDFENVAWDCLGCDEFIVGIETVLAGTGTTSTAYIEGTII